MKENEREKWKTRAGFIAAASGSAIGLGNIWRFPYITGKYGGGVFVFIYILLLIFIGYPIMNSELLLGRKTERNPVGVYRTLAPGSPWILVGFMGVTSGFIILSYYSVVAGWALSYIFKSTLYMANNADATNIFFTSISSTFGNIFWHTIFMLLCTGIVIGGIEHGIEHWARIVMPVLLSLLIILTARSVTLPNSGEGLSFYLRPDFSRLSTEGFLAALGQVFFSLSLGMGCMITYGSYLKKDEDLPLNAKYVVGMDTIIALLAGLVIFPAVFSLGLKPEIGPSLTFITIPSILAKMGIAGHIFGLFFFILLVIAALTSAISLLEVVTAYFIDEIKWNRKKAGIIVGIGIWLLGILPSLGYSTFSYVKLIKGYNILDSFDFITNNILLPLGGLLVTLFIGWFWGTDNALEEANRGTNNRLGIGYSFLIKYVIPFAIFIIFLNSIGIL